MGEENCKFHPDVEAVRTCAECGAPVCPECRVRVEGSSYCPPDAERLFGIHFGTLGHAAPSRSGAGSIDSLQEELSFDLPPLIPGRHENLGLHEVLLVNGILLWVIGMGLIALLAASGSAGRGSGTVFQGAVLQALDGVVLIASIMHVVAGLGLRSDPYRYGYLGLGTALLMLGASLDLILSLPPVIAIVAFPGMALPVLSISAIMLRWHVLQSHVRRGKGRAARRGPGPYS